MHRSVYISGCVTTWMLALVIILAVEDVEHGDLRSPNVLWNSKIGNVVLTDFERSEM